MKSERRKAEGARQTTRSAGSSLILHSSSLLLALCLLAPAQALTQVTTDPTRPPAGLDTGATDGSDGDAAAGVTLQSVLISPTHKAAIINGVMVRLGEKFGDAVLVKVAESEVVLKSGTATQVLKLYPGVEKREVAGKGPRPAKPKTAEPAPR
jgi:MSHA biogenesis protein MshK